MISARDPLTGLDDYLSGYLGDAEAAAYEDDLFAAAAAGAPEVSALDFVDSLARMSARLAAAGDFAGAATRAQFDALAAAGVRLHFVDLGPGGATVVPPWSPDTQLVVTRLGVDVRGFETVDVEVETPDGRAVKTFREVICDPADGALYGVCQEPLARLAFTRGRTILSVVGMRGGRRETVAVFQVAPPGI